MRSSPTLTARAKCSKRPSDAHARISFVAAQSIRRTAISRHSCANAFLRKMPIPHREGLAVVRLGICSDLRRAFRTGASSLRQAGSLSPAHLRQIPLPKQSRLRSLGRPPLGAQSGAHQLKRPTSKCLRPEPSRAIPPSRSRRGTRSAKPTPRAIPRRGTRLGRAAPGERLLHDIARALDTPGHRGEHHLECALTAPVQALEVGRQVIHIHKGLIAGESSSGSASSSKAIVAPSDRAAREPPRGQR